MLLFNPATPNLESQHLQTSRNENLLGDPNFAGEMRDMFLAVHGVGALTIDPTAYSSLQLRLRQLGGAAEQTGSFGW
jgi:hypothetical protein